MIIIITPPKNIKTSKKKNQEWENEKIKILLIKQNKIKVKAKVIGWEEEDLEIAKIKRPETTKVLKIRLKPKALIKD